MHGFEAKKFSYFFSIGVFYTLVRGCNKEIYPQNFQILLLWSTRMVKPTKLLQKLTIL